MIVRFFKSNQSASLIVIPVIAMLLWSFAFSYTVVINTAHTMPFYELAGKGIGNYKILSVLIALFLVVIEAVLLNYIVNEHELLNKRSYLPLLLYIVLMSSCFPLLMLHPVLFANLFLLFALNKLLTTYRKDRIFSEVFDAGFFIALASLFYFPAIVFFLIIWISLLIFRPFVWREWVISFMGLIVPYLFVIVYYYWFDILDYLWYDKMSFPISDRYVKYNLPQSSYPLIGILILIALVSISKLTVVLNTVRSKKTFSIFIWVLILSMLSFLLAPSNSIQYLSFIAIPLSVYLSNYFLYAKKSWIAEIIFFLLISAIVYNNVISKKENNIQKEQHHKA